jgi:hypothetical protein
MTADPTRGPWPAPTPSPAQRRAALIAAWLPKPGEPATTEGQRWALAETSKPTRSLAWDPPGGTLTGEPAPRSNYWDAPDAGTKADTDTVERTHQEGRARAAYWLTWMETGDETKARQAKVRAAVAEVPERSREASQASGFWTWLKGQYGEHYDELRKTWGNRHAEDEIKRLYRSHHSAKCRARGAWGNALVQSPTPGCRGCGMIKAGGGKPKHHGPKSNGKR